MMQDMSTTTSTWPSYSQTSFGEWEDIDDNGTMRLVKVHDDTEAFYDRDIEDAEADDLEACCLFVSVKRGNLPEGWAALCGIELSTRFNWAEVTEVMDLYLTELTEEALAHMTRRALLGDLA